MSCRKQNAFSSFRYPALLGYLLVFASFASADTPQVELCTKQSVCGAHSQIWNNVIKPIAPAELEKASQILKTCADANHPFAQFSTAYGYEVGSGFQKNPKLALEYYVKAGMNGSTAAMGMLVDYLNGKMSADHAADRKECYAWAFVATKLGDKTTGERERFCHGSEEEREQGKKRAEELLAKISTAKDAACVVDCRDFVSAAPTPAQQ